MGVVLLLLLLLFSLFTFSLLLSLFNLALLFSLLFNLFFSRRLLLLLRLSLPFFFILRLLCRRLLSFSPTAFPSKLLFFFCPVVLPSKLAILPISSSFSSLTSLSRQELDPVDSFPSSPLFLVSFRLLFLSMMFFSSACIKLKLDIFVLGGCTFSALRPKLRKMGANDLRLSAATRQVLESSIIARKFNLILDPGSSFCDRQSRNVRDGMKTEVKYNHIGHYPAKPLSYFLTENTIWGAYQCQDSPLGRILASCEKNLICFLIFIFWTASEQCGRGQSQQLTCHMFVCWTLVAKHSNIITSICFIILIFWTTSEL